MATFEALINDEWMSLLDTSFTNRNEKVLSLLNDFEDGKWRFSKFQNFIWDNIIETALSQGEKEKLVGQNQSALIEAAKNLRLTDKENEPGKGSELAEILLYGIMKHYYNGLPVVPKIYYKQSNQDNAKGADSVHIVLEGDEDFSIWLGEAKFYKDLNAAIDAAIRSIKETLKTEKLKKENRIITGLQDIDQLLKTKAKEELANKIKSFLSNENSIDDFKPKLHIPVLFLYECKKTKNNTRMSDKYRTEIKNYHISKARMYFDKQNEKLSSVGQYEDIKFHLILFPVPDKTEIVNKFISNVEFYREQ